jgi:putative ABC transport system permease protein
MRFIDLFEEIYSTISANKARSALTILGIVIGIASVIALVSIGQGAQGSIEASIESIGSNLLIVSPGAQRGPGTEVSAGRGSAQTLTLADATSILNEISSVKAIAPEVSRRYQISAKGQNTNTQVTGTTSSYPEVRNIQIDQGNFISDQQNLSLAKVAVIGPTARDDIFGQDTDAIGQYIRINNVQFRVIGITKSKGGTGFNNADDAIYVPLATAQTYLAGGSSISDINIEVDSQADMTQTQTEITNLLLERHNIASVSLADFSVISQADIVATASSVTGTFTILLSAIAGISLLVGGIGIMNMMLTTVTERTREIGLRKAIGAQRRDISLQFLAEAITLTFSGGLIGVLLGWLMAYLAKTFFSLPSAITLSSVLLAFGVSAAIGVIFGYYPARRAASLNPIEALRFE